MSWRDFAQHCEKLLNTDKNFFGPSGGVFAHIFNTSDGYKAYVDKPRVAKALKWFDPLIPESKTGPRPVHSRRGFRMSEIKEMLEQTWFREFATFEETQKLLQNEPDGSFIVRFSSKVDGDFSVGIKSAGKVEQYRFDRKGKGIQIYWEALDKRYNNLTSWVEKHQRETFDPDVPHLLRVPKSNKPPPPVSAAGDEDNAGAD